MWIELLRDRLHWLHTNNNNLSELWCLPRFCFFVCITSTKTHSRLLVVICTTCAYSSITCPTNGDCTVLCPAGANCNNMNIKCPTGNDPTETLSSFIKRCNPFQGQGRVMSWSQGALPLLRLGSSLVVKETAPFRKFYSYCKNMSGTSIYRLAWCRCQSGASCLYNVMLPGSGMTGPGKSIDPLDQHWIYVTDVKRSFILL